MTPWQIIKVWISGVVFAVVAVSSGMVVAVGRIPWLGLGSMAYGIYYLVSVCRRNQNKGSLVR